MVEYQYLEKGVKESKEDSTFLALLINADVNGAANHQKVKSSPRLND
jgi:hypothetical protein